jgi:crotonobetainyl-CoA:carnitine CoA-transferase CaiB-like acyl-CoA transferase
MDDREGPLHGVRVIDLTRILAGPFCTQQLADLGADVIKVEPPEGDPVRRQGEIVDGLSWYFAAFNRNKRSVVLDLRREDGRETLARLLAQADMLVENFRPGVLAKIGFDPERLEAINPRLIVVSVNGYGSTGPYADRPAFDFVAQAMSGLMAVNGWEGGPPMRVAPPITDLIAGLYAALGAVSALAARGRTGRGQRVEAAMLNGAVSMLAYISANFLASGRPPARTGNDHPIAAPYGLFRCADGEVAVAPSTEPILRRFLEAVGLSDALDGDPRFADNAARVAHRDEINALIDAAMAAQPRAHWVETLNRAGVPCGVVRELDQVFDDPQLQVQEMVVEVAHPGHGVVRMAGCPVKLSDTPAAVRRPAPRLGEHTEEVLAELARR